MIRHGAMGIVLSAMVAGPIANTAHAASTADTLVRCDVMTGKQFAVAVGGVLATVALQLAEPELTRGQKVVLWLLVAIFWIAFGLHEMRYRRWRVGMSLTLMVILGAVLGAIAGASIYAIFPPSTAAKTSDPTALIISKSAGPAMVSMSPLIPDPNQTPADPIDLEFYFFALMAAVQGEKIQYADVTVTNRSPRKMYLELWGQVDYWKDSGEPARLGFRAEWNPVDMKEGTGQTFIELAEWETKKGRLVLFLEKPEKHGLANWFADANENVYVEIFDSVTGKRIAFKPGTGYPSGQMTAPLPSSKTLLALDFPEIAPNGAQAAPNLELIARIRNQGYNGTKVSVDALFANHSPKPMELEVSVLIRSVNVDNTWLSNEGLLTKEGAMDSPGERTLKIEPGATLVRRMTFDLAAGGVPSKGGWNLRSSGKDTLLQITDRISGIKVWCAFRAGYPPGTDLRSATIVISELNSAKPKQDESKDPK